MLNNLSYVKNIFYINFADLKLVIYILQYFLSTNVLALELFYNIKSIITNINFYIKDIKLEFII